ncbi:hypothetical protein L7F22_067129 [Adiantum nelumboides]|nr:hypothetical protein [Adiantum nelumboides]
MSKPFIWQEWGAVLVNLSWTGHAFCFNCITAWYVLAASSRVIQALYGGKERSMMVINCHFCIVGNALVLLNSREDKQRAELQVMHVVCVNSAWNDNGHRVVKVREKKRAIYAGLFYARNQSLSQAILSQ